MELRDALLWKDATEPPKLPLGDNTYIGKLLSIEDWQPFQERIDNAELKDAATVPQFVIDFLMAIFGHIEVKHNGRLIPLPFQIMEIAKDVSEIDRLVAVLFPKSMWTNNTQLRPLTEEEIIAQAIKKQWDEAEKESLVIRETQPKSLPFSIRASLFIRHYGMDAYLNSLYKTDNHVIPASRFLLMERATIATWAHERMQLTHVGIHAFCATQGSAEANRLGQQWTNNNRKELFGELSHG